MPKAKARSAPNSRPRAASAPASSKRLSRFDVEVASEEPDWTCLGSSDAGAAVAAIATAIAAHVPLPAGLTTASLVLANDARVRDLNKQWRQQDKATNVLSFPSGESPGGDDGHHDSAGYFAGDVILAEETLVREAHEQGIPVADHFHHLALHGLLHLLGFDHETDAGAEAMEALETTILASLGIADPYADTELEASNGTSSA